MDPSNPRSNGKQRETVSEILDVEDEEQRHERIHGLFTHLNASTKSSTNAAPPQRAFDLEDRATFPSPPLELLSRLQAFLPELAASNADLLRRAKEDPSSVDIEHLRDDQLQYIEMNLGLGVFEHHGNPNDVPAGIPVADVDVNFDPDSEDSDAVINITMDSSSPSKSKSKSSQSRSASPSSSSSSESGSSSSSSSSSNSDSNSDDSSDNDAQVNTNTKSSHPHSNAHARPIKPLPKRNTSTLMPASLPLPPPLPSSRKPEIVVLSENNRHGGGA